VESEAPFTANFEKSRAAPLQALENCAFGWRDARPLQIFGLICWAEPFRGEVNFSLGKRIMWIPGETRNLCPVETWGSSAPIQCTDCPELREK